MKKLNLMWIIAILLLSTAIADNGMIETYKPNQNFNLPVHLTNSTGDVLGANCSIEIRQSNYSIILQSIMNEIDGGYYNYSYNLSQMGYYICNQNCTQGTSYTSESCDFKIEGDQMLMAVIVLIPLFIMFFMLFVAWLLPAESYPALKIGLILTSFIFVYQTYQFAVIGLTSETSLLVDSIGDNTLIYTWVYGIVFAVILLTFIYDIFMMFSNKKHKTGEGYDDEQR
jgi:hypothetical protein